MTTRVRASVLALTFASILAVPTIAAAQEPVAVGVKAGVNFAKLKFEDEEDMNLKNRVGAIAGIFVGKAINDTVGIRGEALFSQKGAKLEVGSGIEDGEFRLTYIDVPVLLTVGPKSSGNAQFNFFTGPQISFKTKAESEFLGETEDAGDDVKSTDFGWAVGVGVSGGRFSVDARYTLGLTNIAKDGDENVKNRAFTVMVGVKLSK